MIGAVTMSRIVTEPEVSAAILERGGDEFDGSAILKVCRDAISSRAAATRWAMRTWRGW
jgi:hypothetical protein